MCICKCNFSSTIFGIKRISSELNLNLNSMKKLLMRGSAIGRKLAPPYAILFMADLQQKIPNTFEEKPMI